MWVQQSDLCSLQNFRLGFVECPRVRHSDLSSTQELERVSEWLTSWSLQWRSPQRMRSTSIVDILETSTEQLQTVAWCRWGQRLTRQMQNLYYRPCCREAQPQGWLSRTKIIINVEECFSQRHRCPWMFVTTLSKFEIKRSMFSLHPQQESLV